MLILTYNNNKIQLPTELQEINLGQFIAYYQQYAQDLSDKLEKKYLETEAAFKHVSEKEIELQQEIIFDQHLDEEAIAWFCFWSGTSPDEAKAAAGITDVIEHYRLFRESLLADAEGSLESFENRIVIDGEAWTLQDFRQSSEPEEMTSKELILARYILSLVAEVKIGNWTQIPKLLAIYLRKEGEAFDPDFLFSVERLEKINSLPMDAAVRCCHLLRQATDQLGLPSNQYLQSFCLN